MGELYAAGRLHGDAMTAAGKPVSETVGAWRSRDTDVILPYDAPMRQNAGFLVLSGNLFDSAITSGGLTAIVLCLLLPEGKTAETKSPASLNKIEQA